MAHELGLLVVVENPRSSLFWLTRFWKQIKAPMQYSAHQACAYGGERPKWTVLALNHPAFAAISKCCPGESALHKHKPWGLVHSELGTHLSTSEEAAYPTGLARAIARVFASILTAHGWKPPLEQLQEQHEVSLRSMRAIATAQPKASKMPPIVREHRKVLITGPFADLATAPVDLCNVLSHLGTYPNLASLNWKFCQKVPSCLRTTPLRSKGGLLVLNDSSVGVFEQAWGIPFSPDELFRKLWNEDTPNYFPGWYQKFCKRPSRTILTELVCIICPTIGSNGLQNGPKEPNNFSNMTQRSKVHSLLMQQRFLNRRG